MLPDDDFDFEAHGPQEGDITTPDHLNFYQDGRRVLSINPDDDMWALLESYMERVGVFPDVWFISDHGNAHLLEK